MQFRGSLCGRVPAAGKRGQNRVLGLPVSFLYQRPVKMVEPLLDLFHIPFLRYVVKNGALGPSGLGKVFINRLAADPLRMFTDKAHELEFHVGKPF